MHTLLMHVVRVAQPAVLLLQLPYFQSALRSRALLSFLSGSSAWLVLYAVLCVWPVMSATSVLQAGCAPA